MLNALERYDKNEAPIVVYRVKNDTIDNKKDIKNDMEQISLIEIDDKIDKNSKVVSLKNFLDLVKELKGNVWIVCNWALKDTLEEHRKGIHNLYCFYLIESKEVNQFILAHMFRFFYSIIFI